MNVSLYRDIYGVIIQFSSDKNKLNLVSKGQQRPTLDRL